ncbi:DUF4228 domain-containing protein [Quillaja saponaria]|uniref:DUF4228 domain-containing protein n=1 Tax=Quillaja saponaria TaxID=32244 RepID=A0AAD7Q793_QUISA|nr:DUF4228 domain-containing protein [Quillaja saponaria]
MGNCLVLQENIVKIMKADGKILEYKAPIKVQQVLSEFSGHAISDTVPVIRHLQQDTRLFGGQLYYLVPLPLPSPKVGKKKVRFLNPEVQIEKESSVVRVKLVISKQQLQDMLQKEGISVNEMVARLQSEEGIDGGDVLKTDDCCEGWKPVLESIPELI